MNDIDPDAIKRQSIEGRKYDPDEVGPNPFRQRAQEQLRKGKVPKSKRKRQPKDEEDKGGEE